LTKSEPFLNGTDGPATAGRQTERSGGAGRKGGWGERNSRPALAFATAEFRASEAGAPPKLVIFLD